MDTFALSSDFIAIGCQKCNRLLGKIEIFSFEAGFPQVFEQIGSDEKGNSNYNFGAQTEMVKKDDITIVFVTSS